MNYNKHPLVGSAIHIGRPPWLLFLFIAAIFFLWEHDLYSSRKAIESFNPSYDQLITQVDEGLLSRRIALFALGLFAIVSLVRERGRRRLGIHGPLGWMFLFFIAWALISPIWAEDLALTLRRLVVFVTFSIAAAVIAHRFSSRDLVLWILFSTTLFLIIGMPLEVFFGTFRPFASGYRFAGTLGPNNQGVNCALLLLSGLAAADLVKHKRTLFRACALLGFVFLILTASRTSFAAALVALAVYVGTVSSRVAKIAMAYALSIAFCVLVLLLGNALLPDLRSVILLGRDDSSVDSFTGRAGIWNDVFLYIHRRPLLGYGYGGFWTPAHISEISDEEKWAVPDSHSVYLDYFLNLGAVGLVAYTLLLFAGIRRAFRFHKFSENPAFAFCGAVLVFCALDGLLESAAGDPSLLMFLSWVVLASLAFAPKLLVTPIGNCEYRGQFVH